MSRILALVVLLVIAVLTVPALREHAQPHIEWALTPLYRWETRNRVNDIQRLLERERSVGARLPSEREFRGFLEQREGADAALDRWGEPFFLEVTRTSFRVGSSGQDRTRGTGHDIFSKPFENPERR